MKAHSIDIFGRRFRLPRSRLLRICIGAGLVFCGILGFLPVLGFWMIPLGLLVLSHDLPRVRRWRRRFFVWWERRRAARSSAPAMDDADRQTGRGRTRQPS